MSIIQKTYLNLWYLFGNPPWDTNISPPELLEYIDNNPSGRALDLGCGTGTNAISLAKHGWEVNAVDFSAVAIMFARRKARREGLDIDFFVDDVSHLREISGSFDLILDIGCFHNLDESKRHTYVSNIDRLLAPSGTYLLYAILLTPENSGFLGMEETALHVFHPALKLTKREDGMNFDERPSAWFWFKKPRSI